MHWLFYDARGVPSRTALIHLIEGLASQEPQMHNGGLAHLFAIGP